MKQMAPMKPDFLFGAQYYRAPTPESDNWETDLANMKAMGYTDVKFWVQWRWCQRGEQEYYFDDIDRLMDLAEQNGLRVTLNVIFDVMPKWLGDRYPDCRMILADGSVVELSAPGHRQMGGFPGPCYNHPEALAARMDFLRRTVLRYRNHPAMYMWDVWNEPEQCGLHRYAKQDKLSCFCDHCKRKFSYWLMKKYGTVEKLNRVWGRFYRDFGDIELPRERFTFTDFVDFRQFHIDKMTGEANTRLQIVKLLDPWHITYLHVVPNTSGIFNALTGVDDFALAKSCDVFASTNFATPIWSVLTASAGKGKICYNVECHIANGSTQMHQKQITLADMVKDLVPQLGMGLRGFLFWQYRAELLGFEAPAWGCTQPDGSIGSVGRAARDFIGKLTPYLPQIMAVPAPQPRIAIWKDCKNEVFSYCVYDELTGFAGGIEATVNALYDSNFDCCVVDDEAVCAGLAGINLLIMPQCYALTEGVAEALRCFVEEGGTLLCEAHLAGYELDNGRHATVMPGYALAQSWGIREEYTTASYHLPPLETNTAVGKTDSPAEKEDLPDDMKKALQAYGTAGGKYFPVPNSLGISLWGAERFAALSAEHSEPIAHYGDAVCILHKHCGRGSVIYCGTNLSLGASQDIQGYARFLQWSACVAGVQPNTEDTPYGVHIDRLGESLICINNRSDSAVSLQLETEVMPVFDTLYKGNGRKITMPPCSAGLFVCKQQA